MQEERQITVYYLEMREHNRRTIPAPRDGLEVVFVRKPTVRYYRFLYDAIGADYDWYSRKILPDAELERILSDRRNELHVLHVDGTPAGMAELDRRTESEVELVQFGLLPEFIGQGLGKWFLQWTIDRAWSYRPARFWLHTCSKDHPRALPLYRSAGFVVYKQEIQTRPRRRGPAGNRD